VGLLVPSQKKRTRPRLRRWEQWPTSTSTPRRRSRPGRILAALTDFTDRRLDYWPSLDRRLYQVHATGDTWAEVTEGAAFAGGIWERGRAPSQLRVSRPGAYLATKGPLEEVK
jgi:hypothetical protein